MVPFKYELGLARSPGWLCATTGCRGSQHDRRIALWNNTPRPDRRRAPHRQRNLAFFSTADSPGLPTIWWWPLYRLITNPELRQYILRQAFGRGDPTPRLSVLHRVTRACDEGEIFNMYHEIPSVAKRPPGAQVTPARSFQTRPSIPAPVETDRICCAT